MHSLPRLEIFPMRLIVPLIIELLTKIEHLAEFIYRPTLAAATYLAANLIIF
jgi:hypothetical protein